MGDDALACWHTVMVTRACPLLCRLAGTRNSYTSIAIELASQVGAAWSCMQRRRIAVCGMHALRPTCITYLTVVCMHACALCGGNT